MVRGDSIKVNMAAALSLYLISVLTWTQNTEVLQEMNEGKPKFIPSSSFNLSLSTTYNELTVVGTFHEVVPCHFGVFAVHLTSLWVKPGELESVEAVVVLHETESSCAVGHGFELMVLFHRLVFDGEVVDLMFCGQTNELGVSFKSWAVSKKKQRHNLICLLQ